MRRSSSWCTVSESLVTKGPLSGYKLLRMARPANWPTEWCQHVDEQGKECDNLHPKYGYMRRCSSMWAAVEPGGMTGGWRVACGRKHAMAILEREYSEP